MPASPKSPWLEWTVILLTRLMIVLTRLKSLVWARVLSKAVGAGLYYFNGRMRRVVARQSAQSTGELMSVMGRVWRRPWAQTAAVASNLIKKSGPASVLGTVLRARKGFRAVHWPAEPGLKR